MTRFSAFLIIAGCLTVSTTSIQAAPGSRPAQVCNTLAMQDPLSTPDTVHTSAANLTTDSTASEGKPKKKDLINRFLDYFNDANKAKKDKKFDFSIIGGPHYSTDTKFGVGLVAAGLYRTDRQDTLLPPSNVSIFSDISSVGFYMIGVRGTHIMPRGKYRINYTTYFYSFPSDYWGMGYDNGNNDNNKSEMKRLQAQAQASFLFRIAPNTYLGPAIAFDYIKGKDIERPELLEGMDTETTNFGVGYSFVYDSRDVLTNPHEGLYINLLQYFRPGFLGNDYHTSTTTMQCDIYRRVWKGGILAADVRAEVNFGNPSWGMMAKLGNSNSMRGYYEGRYRDKHKIEVQAELRQHVWKRNGITVWAGAGTVFDEFGAIRMSRVLPNFGLGYRWEFKKDVNVRLDYGFGKSGQSGFIFNINEAF